MPPLGGRLHGRKSPGTMRSLTVEGDDAGRPEDGRLIPIPDVPLGPVLSLAAFLPRGRPAIPSMLDGGPALMVTAGRVAIALALELSGLGKGDKVLIPAYHCATMVSPLAWVGAEPVFYRIADDLSVDLADVVTRLGPRVRAILVTHYFGFPQDMPAVRKFCDDHGLLLIEDCAHCFYGRVDGRPVGSFGDYSIGSPRKFFAVSDGGCLVSARRPVMSRPLHQRPWGAEALAAYRLIDRAIDYGRLPALRPLRAGVRQLAGAMRRGAEPASAAAGAPDSSGASVEFDGDVTLRMAAFSRWVCRATSAERAITRRRDNYRLLAEGLSDVAGCRPLRPALPRDVVPYMFPLWIDELPGVFPRLEDAAVPMQRFGQFLWSGVDASVCPVTARLSRHSIQVACHQELGHGEIEAIVSRVRTVVADGRTRQRAGRQDLT